MGEVAAAGPGEAAAGEAAGARWRRNGSNGFPDPHSESACGQQTCVQTVFLPTSPVQVKFFVLFVLSCCLMSPLPFCSGGRQSVPPRGAPGCQPDTKRDTDKLHTERASLSRCFSPPFPYISLAHGTKPFMLSRPSSFLPCVACVWLVPCTAAIAQLQRWPHSHRYHRVN